MQQASNAVLQAFNATLDSEKAGGNVSSLLTQLNMASSLLTEAETAYNAGKDDAGAAKVEQACQIAQSVQTQASSLKSSSMTESNRSFLFTAATSGAGSAITIFALLLLWRKVKAVHSKSVLKSKPQVYDDEA